MVDQRSHSSRRQPVADCAPDCRDERLGQSADRGVVATNMWHDQVEIKLVAKYLYTFLDIGVLSRVDKCVLAIPRRNLGICGNLSPDHVVAPESALGE